MIVTLLCILFKVSSVQVFLKHLHVHRLTYLNSLSVRNNPCLFYLFCSHKTPVIQPSLKERSAIFLSHWHLFCTFWGTVTGDKQRCHKDCLAGWLYNDLQFKDVKCRRKNCVSGLKRHRSPGSSPSLSWQWVSHLGNQHFACPWAPGSPPQMKLFRVIPCVQLKTGWQSVCTTRRRIKQVAKMLVTWWNELSLICSHLGSIMVSVTFKPGTPRVLTLAGNEKPSASSFPSDLLFVPPALWNFSMKSVHEGARV